MGTWGEGNFENDNALNMLAFWINKIIDKIREGYAFEPDATLYDGNGEEIVANIDILATLFAHYRFYPDLQPDEVSRWKQDYLSTFDIMLATFSDQESIVEGKERRNVVAATFDRLDHTLRQIVAEMDG